jgi:hypothetical protein
MVLYREHWMFKVSLLSCLLLIFSMPSFSYGEIELSGFASIGAGRLQHDNVRYIDFTDEWSFNSDSVIGIQAQIEFSDRWSLITQVVASGYDYTDNAPFTPNLEWFVLGYQLDSNTQLRFGRFRAPQYRYSTTLEVGYTYQWVRPSPNAYPLFFSPFRGVDGIDITHNVSYDDVNVGYQVFLGETEGKYEGTEVDAEFTFGGNIFATWSNFSARVSAQQFTISVEFPGFSQLVGGYEAFASAYSGTPGAEEALLLIPSSFSSESQKVNYLSLGFSYDVGRWTFASEILNLRSEDRNFANDTDGYYISAAYQFKNISPYITIGEYHNRFSDDIKNKVIASEAVLTVGDTLEISEDLTLDRLRAQTLATFQFFNVDQETITLGVRYDFHPNADFKIEVEYFNFLNGSYGNMYPDSVTDPGRDTVLTSFVIDVVF